jgi:hypothetical protein
MNSPANCKVIGIKWNSPFMTLVQQVLSLGPAIEWVAPEKRLAANLARLGGAWRPAGCVWA